MEQENIILSKVRQIQKAKKCMYSFYWPKPNAKKIP
jgi:hypothetical protein